MFTKRVLLAGVAVVLLSGVRPTAAADPLSVTLYPTGVEPTAAGVAVLREMEVVGWWEYYEYWDGWPGGVYGLYIEQSTYRVTINYQGLTPGARYECLGTTFTASRTGAGKVNLGEKMFERSSYYEPGVLPYPSDYPTAFWVEVKRVQGGTNPTVLAGFF